ncbi:hypothetical protein Tco_1031054 [Tanacetum coccineum]|uniref:Uncharacterized protein n=1 Tax=Tanacetum coccineum TaxID=301880 RepID=A0ABQ5G9M2_9ASTR
MSAVDYEKNRMSSNTNSPIDNLYELKIGDEFLKILKNNAFNGMYGGDVIDHIAKVVKITEWIKIPDIDKNRVRIHNGNNKIINKECSPILAPARHDICDQDELCRTEEFAVVKYSVGLDKEFVAVGPSETSTVKGTHGSIHAIWRIEPLWIRRLHTALAKLGRNGLMCSHELYKFSDGTLISLRDTLKDMANNLEMGYTSVMSRRRWSNLDKKMSHIMINDIDRQLLDRRLMKSLEKFVDGRYYGEDPRLL